MAQSLGSFSFVLHSHLPYVLNHGRWPHGTDWLHEAALGCYLPLLRTIMKLDAKGIRSGVTLGVSPVLAEQLADPSFHLEFREYLKVRLDYARQNQREFIDQGQEEMAELAQFWLDHIKGVREFYEDTLGRDILGGFKKLAQKKTLELMTCAATHGYFPLLSTDASLRLQTAQAVRTHERHFGEKPVGMWLPECAYRPSYDWAPPNSRKKPIPRKGVEEILAEFGIRFFITDSHMLEGGEAIGTYLDRFKALRGLWERYEKGALPKEKQADRSTCFSYWVASREKQDAVAAVFARDPETALTVWSAEVGYPGDGWYLDFHKKHFPGGLKYWRVTKAKSDLAEKEVYEPWRIEDRLNENADHFVSVVKKRLKAHLKAAGKPGHVTAPFDTELFGHWWFEGPRFLEKVLNRLSGDPDIELISCGEKLRNDPPREVISLPEGSWGQGGFHWIWLNEDTEWTWPKIYECEKILGKLKRLAKEPKGVLKKALDQAARELLLLQASDWQFLISTWSARDYAELRFSEHYSAFKRLAKIVSSLSEGKQVGQGDLFFLEEISQRDSLFPDLDLNDWRDKGS